MGHRSSASALKPVISFYAPQEKIRFMQQLLVAIRVSGRFYYNY
jgi:hypothetical protein